MHLGGEEGGRRWRGPLAQHESRFGIKMLLYSSFASFLPRPVCFSPASPARSLIGEEFQHPTRRGAQAVWEEKPRGYR